MTTLGSRGFRVSLCLLALGALALIRAAHFHASAVALPRSATDALVDHLVERQREALHAVGVPDARRLSWFLLRDQFAILAIQAREVDHRRLVRVQVWSNPDIPTHIPSDLYLTLTPGEDDTWTFAPLNPPTFWLR